MNRTRRGQEFEGKDIMYYINNPIELERLIEGVIDDELTRGRIRTIYVKMKYGTTAAKQLAEYYNLDEALIKDIAKGKIFREITKGLE